VWNRNGNQQKEGNPPFVSCRSELRSALQPFDFAQGSAEGKITVATAPGTDLPPGNSGIRRGVFLKWEIK
jgi:hypothetical protein